MPLNVPIVDTFEPFRQGVGQLQNALRDVPRQQMEQLQLGEAQRHQQENQELQQLMARTPATQRPQVAIQFLESKGRTQDAAVLKHERFQQFHDQYQIDPQSAITSFPEYGVDPSRAAQISTTEIPGTKSVAVRQAGKTSFVQRDPTDAEVQSEATARAKGTMEGGRKTPEELLQDVTQAGAVAGAQEEARQKFKPDPREQGVGRTVTVGGRVKQLDPATGRYTIDVGPAPPTQASQSVALTEDALNAEADYYNKTHQLSSFGMSAQGGVRQQIMNRAAERSKAAGGAGGADFAGNKASYEADKASLSKATSMLDAVTAFEGTASANLDQFLNTAKGVVDSGSPWINQPLRSITRGALGGGDIKAYDAARTVALTEIAKVINNPNLTGVLNESARKEVEALIPENATLKEVFDVSKILKSDMANRHTFLAKQIQDIKGRIGGSGGGTGTTPAAGPRIVQKNKTTGAYRHSDDGGQTWQAGQ